MGVNIMAKGRKIYSVPAVAGILKGSIREVLYHDARLIEMVVRNLDETAEVTIKPQESASKLTGYADMAAGAVAASRGLTATQHDTLVLPPLGRGTMRFTVGTQYWALSGSGVVAGTAIPASGLIEVSEMAQNWSPTEGHGDQS